MAVACLRWARGRTGPGQQDRGIQGPEKPRKGRAIASSTATRARAPAPAERGPMQHRVVAAGRILLSTSDTRRGGLGLGLQLSSRVNTRRKGARGTEGCTFQCIRLVLQLGFWLAGSGYERPCLLSVRWTGDTAEIAGRWRECFCILKIQTDGRGPLGVLNRGDLGSLELWFNPGMVANKQR